MEKISKAIKERREILNEMCLGQAGGQRSPYFYMPDEIIDSYLNEIKKVYSLVMARSIGLVFMVLSRRSDKYGICYPAYELIMKCALISNRNQLAKILKIMRVDLKMFDYIRGKGKGSSNVYKLFDAKFWTPVSSIKSKVSSINLPHSQYQPADTLSTVLKENIYKEEENNSSKALTILPCRSLLVVSNK